MACDCCDVACFKMKWPFSMNSEKADEKNLGYLYKTDSEIKLKTTSSYFIQCILQTAVTNRK